MRHFMPTSMTSPMPVTSPAMRRSSIDRGTERHARRVSVTSRDGVGTVKRGGRRPKALSDDAEKENADDVADAETVRRAAAPSFPSASTSASASNIAPVSPRRVFIGATGATALALGANFLGATSSLLSRDEATRNFARSNRLDVLYPVNGYTRCYSSSKGYEFIVPVNYLLDQTMASRNATRGAESLDPLSARELELRSRNVSEPDSAFGPMGSSGEENVSVITSAVPRGFDLGVFGGAGEQAEWLLNNVLAKPGSGKTGKLIGASQRVIRGVTYYTFEYTIQSDQGWFRHNVAVFATRGSTLYTFVAQIPESRWLSMRDSFFAMAESFRVFVPSG